jgi:hypothetical protein
MRSYLVVSWQWPYLALTAQQSALDLTDMSTDGERSAGR